MTRYSVGDHVSWNSEAGRVSGKIIKVHLSDFDYKGHRHRASKDEPQYLIESDKTDHLAMHKGSALTKLRKKAPPKRAPRSGPWSAVGRETTNSRSPRTAGCGRATRLWA